MVRRNNILIIIVKDRNFSSKKFADFPNKSRRKRGNISVLDYINILFLKIMKM